ncbi:MAG TPA: VCBS repeat-containing protein [Saprospiraceae bacterium]|nr:VCBS repeat-containing protein [Saprospiraceae bacterium]
MKNTLHPAGICLIALLSLLLGQCSDRKKTLFESTPQPQATAEGGTRFVARPAAETGISFVFTVEEEYRYNFTMDPYIYNGGGVAVLDVNRDGLQDLFFTARLQGCRLYLNQGNFKFTDISESSGVAKHSGLKTGVVVVDVNADGWPDLYVCRTWLTPVPDRRNLLLINNKDNTFTERAAEFGLADLSASQHANFFDYDLDGDLDCYVVNHPVDFHNINIADYQPSGAAPSAAAAAPKTEYDSDRLYRNDGNGHFSDVSKAAGIINRAWGLSSIAADFNDDGWPDLFVANDFIMPDFLYINNHDGTFSEQAGRWFRHMANHSMGADYADLNGDALPDLVVPDMLGATPERRKMLMNTMQRERVNTLLRQGYGRQQMRNVLQVNNGNHTFSEQGCQAGIQATEWSWAPLVADYDNDGHNDLFLTSGVLRDLNDLDFFYYTADSINRTGGVNAKRFKSFQEYTGLIPSFPNRNYLYQNTGDWPLIDVTASWGLSQPGFTNGAAYADLDNDGDLDLITSRLGASPGIFENQANTIGKKHWLQIKCEGPAKNPTGIGARIRVQAGDQVFFQEMTPVRGFYSSVEPVFQVGLGAIERVDKVEIEWPGGGYQVLEQLPANQRIVLKYAEAKPGKLPRGQAANLSAGIPYNEVAQQNGLRFTHRENEFDDYERERLLSRQYSRPGPALALGDVDGDGAEDVFVGGARGQSGAIFLQKGDGIFVENPAHPFESVCDAAAALFFDADGDKDLDLIVVNGGNEAPAGDPSYQDRLYRNDGKGNFSLDAGALPTEKESGSVARAYDYDADGDLDLFVGGRVTPGRFPEIPRSAVWRNDGGRFSDVTAEAAPQFERAGMITDLQFADLDGDGAAELIVAGEWMPIRVFKKEGPVFRDVTEAYGVAQSAGWWNCLLINDLDGDGDPDILAGNEGLNGRFVTWPGGSLRLFAADFDGNGSIDPVLTAPQQGGYAPVAQRDLLAQQLPGIRKKFPRYHDYALAGIEDLFSAQELRAARQLEAAELRSGWFENNNGKLVFHAFPSQVQVSPVSAVLAIAGENGLPQLLFLGNRTGNEPETGPLDASCGVWLNNRGGGNFQAIPNRLNPFRACGEVRQAAVVHLTKERQAVVVASNNGPVQLFYPQ